MGADGVDSWVFADKLGPGGDPFNQKCRTCGDRFEDEARDDGEFKPAVRTRYVVESGKGDKGKEKGKPRDLADSWFDDLPGDSFTGPENRLRDAVLDYLEDW